MKFTGIDPPRRFLVSGANIEVTISDCGRVDLQPNEQLTFVTEQDAEYDVVRKDWGFYATPSTNGRLRRFGLRTALVMSSSNRLFVVLVEKGKETAFDAYIAEDRQRVLCWLDNDESVAALAAMCSGDH